MVGKFHLSEIEQLSESPNSKYADKKLDFKDTDDTNLKSEFLTNKGKIFYFRIDQFWPFLSCMFSTYVSTYMLHNTVCCFVANC